MGETVAAIDRFVVERAVGAGGMGAVYRALDRQSGALVALKIAFADDDQHRARAVVEADALASLDHPAIVRLIASGVGPDGRPYLAMEWLDGEDLAARLTRGRLAPAEAAVLGARVAQGLAAAHARGVVHRDLKPSNLFLPGGEIAQAKLVDFGIARQAHLGRRLTATGALLGTPGYMAPEQASSEDEIGPPADMFALGAVLFECLAGLPAFAGENILAVLSKILLEDPPRLDDLRADVPAVLADHLARLLAKDPALRPTAVETAAALADMRTTLGDGAPGQAPASRAVGGDEQHLVCVLLVRPASEPLAAPPAGVDPQRTTALDPVLLSEAHTAQLAAGADALEDLREAIAPFGGRAHRLLDGALVAHWRGVGDARDQAARAARAALEARRRLPGAALALASGLTELRGPLPFGAALDRAAALVEASEAPSDAIRVDEVTAALLDARFDLRASPVGLELTGRRTLDDGEVRRLLGRPVPCVGRERELQSLCAVLDECVQEAVGRFVLVTAPPGTGKSRLRHELLRRVRRRVDVDVWTADADELGAGSPFALLGAALRQVMGARPGDPLTKRRGSLEGRVARHVPEAERARVAVFLGEITAAPFPAAAHPMLAAARRDPATMAEQVRRAFLDLMAAEAAAHPVMLVLDDLHWGDDASIRLIGEARAALRDHPFMVLGLARPEVDSRFPDLCAEQNVYKLRLDGLTRRAAGELIRAALPAADAAVVHRLIGQADGNALYLEELIRAVAEGRGDALPETVVAMVQARLETLSPGERRALRAASIFGDVFWQGAVEALLGGASDLHLSLGGRPGELLASLVAKEVLIRRPSSQLPGEQELAFRHALLREGAYATLTEESRALGHELGGEWLERHALEGAAGDMAGEGSAARIARHFELGRANERAAPWFARAAEHALRAGALAAAEAYAARGLSLLAATPLTQGRVDQERALQISLATALSATRGYVTPEVEGAFRRALELCERAEDAPERIVTLFGIWRLNMVRGEHWTARAYGEDLLALSLRGSTPEASLAASHALGMSCLFLGEYGPAREHFERVTTLYDRARHHDLALFYGGDFESQCLSYLAITRWALGLLDQALTTSQQACAMAEKVSHPLTLAIVLSLAAVHHQFRRDKGAVLTFAERSLTLSEQRGLPHFILLGKILRGWALAGRPGQEDAVAEMRRALAVRRASGADMSMTHLLTLEAEALCDIGKPDEALATLDETEAVMDRSAERLWAPEVYRLKGEILKGRGVRGAMAAEDCFLRALDVARCQGALTLELRATTSLARLWWAQGSGEEARRTLEVVLARVTEGLDTRDVTEARALLDAEGRKRHLR